MTTRISSSPNRRTRTELLGGALVRFDRGIADLEDPVRPGILSAALRAGYRISDDDPATEPPKRRPRTPRRKAGEEALDPAAPITGQAEGADVAGEQLAADDVVEDQADELANSEAAGAVETADGVEHVGSVPAGAAEPAP